MNVAGSGVPLQVIESRIALGVDDERELMPFVRDPASGLVPFGGLVWTVSNPALLTINPTTGRVKGIARGDVVVMVAREGRPESATQLFISVVGTANDVVKEVRVTPAKQHLVLGSRVTLRAAVYLPDGQVNANVVWSSSDDTLAVVNPTTGEVRALRTGQVTIVAAYAQDTRFKGLSELTVVASEADLPRPSTPTATPSIPGSVVPQSSAASEGQAAPRPSPVRSQAPITDDRAQALPTPAPTGSPSSSPSHSPSVTGIPTRWTPPTSPSLSPSVTPVTNGIGTRFGGYAVIHPDGHVCGVVVSDGAFVFNPQGTLPMPYMGCPANSPLVFQTGPSETGNVAGWHGENVSYRDGVFTVRENGKVTLTIVDGIVTDADGRVFDAGTGKPVSPSPSLNPPAQNP